jgi:hypothetical protein
MVEYAHMAGASSCTTAAVNSSIVSNPLTTPTETITGSDGVSLGVVIGASLGGILSVVLAFWFGLKYLKPQVGMCWCFLCFQYQVVSSLLFPI